MKLFLKVIFVVLLLANCGVFIILYPQFNSAPLTAPSAGENTLRESSAGELAKIELISEVVRPAPEIYVQPEMEREQAESSVSGDEDDLFLASPPEADLLEQDSSE